ncbi:regulatory protein [Chelonia mydas papillomavirus 1]|uniref:Protein E8^E2C n=1 Tax=Chelonia mydas papillomavirus 1 TaxID=485242 RepID=B6RUP4_9PAPI|nr:regulatory protein [Chelonia mydas papillomavirus 1]
MMDANQRLMEVQNIQLSIIEQDSHTLGSILEFYKAMKVEYLLLAAARKKGRLHIGVQRVPPMQVSETKYREASTMIVLIESLMQSQFRDRKFSLHELQYSLVMTPPEYTVKQGPKQVYITYSDPSQTTEQFTKWKTILYQTDDWSERPSLPGTHDPKWFLAHTLTDKNGLFIVDKSGDKDYYAFFSTKEPSSAVARGQWTISSTVPAAAALSRQPSPRRSNSPNLDPCTRSRGSHCGGVSPSNPDTPDTAGVRPRDRTGGLGTPPKSARGGGGRGQSTGGSKLQRGPRVTPRSSRQSKEKNPVSPAEVGQNRKTVSGPGTRLDRLIREARDPPGVIIEGSTSQIKHLRRRIQLGPLKYLRVTSTWHWIVNKKVQKPCKMIVVFSNNAERQTFLHLFRVEGDGISVRLCSFNGL